MMLHYDPCDRCNIFSCHFLLTLQQNTDTQCRSDGNQTLNTEQIFFLTDTSSNSPAPNRMSNMYTYSSHHCNWLNALSAWFCQLLPAYISHVKHSLSTLCQLLGLEHGEDICARTHLVCSLFNNHRHCNELWSLVVVIQGIGFHMDFISAENFRY